MPRQIVVLRLLALLGSNGKNRDNSEDLNVATTVINNERYCQQEAYGLPRSMPADPGTVTPPTGNDKAAPVEAGVRSGNQVSMLI